MLDEERFADLIGHTYDAALGQEDWSVMLDRLLGVIGGVCASLTHHGGSKAGTVGVGFDPDSFRLYDTYYHWVDPVLPALRRLPPLPSGSAFDDHGLVPRQDLERSEFYNDFLTRWGLNACLFWHWEQPQGRAVTLKIVRSRRQPFFGDEETRLLRSLAPHLGRAQLIERMLAPTRGAQPSGVAPALSGRERECLQAIAGGASSKVIARRLAISSHTVNEYIEGAMRKLGAVNRTEAVAKAMGLGLLGAEAPAVQENR